MSTSLTPRTEGNKKIIGANKMKIAICDDEEMFREQLKTMLENYYHSLDVLMVPYSSGEELVNEIETKQYDLIFLDIEMKGMNGLETAKRVHSISANLPIIFLTSHTELAMEGYEVQAFRFLAKPIAVQKLQEALCAFEKNLRQERKIMIVEDGMNRYLSCTDIQYIKSENVYLQIVTKQGSHLVRKKLKVQIEELPKDTFMLVHRSYIVNLNEVASFDGNVILLHGGFRIPVSRGNREAFKSQMLQFMKKR